MSTTYTFQIQNHEVDITRDGFTIYVKNTDDIVSGCYATVHRFFGETFWEYKDSFGIRQHCAYFHDEKYVIEYMQFRIDKHLSNNI